MQIDARPTPPRARPRWMPSWRYFLWIVVNAGAWAVGVCGQSSRWCCFAAGVLAAWSCGQSYFAGRADGREDIINETS
jgi:hypothetical protein